MFAKPRMLHGVQFSSTLEAKWAHHLGAVGISWDYEPRYIRLRSGQLYKPDFFLPNLGVWLEVKGLPSPQTLDKPAQLARALEGSGQHVLVGLSDGRLLSQVLFPAPEAPRIAWVTAAELECSRCAAVWFDPAGVTCPACHDPTGGARSAASAKALRKAGVEISWLGSYDLIAQTAALKQ